MITRVQPVDEAGAGRRRQNEVYRAGVFGHLPAVPTRCGRCRRGPSRPSSARAYSYVAGGRRATSVTQRANRAAFDRWAVVPRVLRDVSVRDTSVELFGRRLPAPLLLAPVGALELVHDEADLAVARAAAALGVPMVFSNQASVSMEDCAAVMGDAPRWFQLYWSTSDELVESLVGRAEAAGCDALVVTLDTTMLGWRPRDLDLGHLPFALGKGIAQYTSDPVFRRLVEERARRRRRPRSPAPAHAGRGPALVGMAKRLARARSATTCAHRSRAPPSRRSSASTPGPRSPGTTWPGCARGRGCRSCSRACCTPTTPAARWTRGSTASSSARTAAGRSTARSPRSTRCPTSSAADRRAGAGAAGQRDPQRGRRVHRGRARRRRRCCSAGRSPGGSRWPARRACGRWCPTCSASST